MGCSICRGHAHQVCGAPGCQDETKIVIDNPFMRPEKITDGPWRVIERHPLRCDLCSKVAIYAHPAGGLRCETCPRPMK